MAIHPRRVSRVTVLSFVARAAKALYEGRRRAGVLLLAIALLSYRFTAIGIALEVGFRAYRRLGRPRVQ